MAKADPAAHQLAAGVGPSPHLASHHRGDRTRIRDAAVETDFASYAAHEAGPRLTIISQLRRLRRGSEASNSNNVWHVINR